MLERQIELSAEHRAYLEQVQASGVTKARVLKRAMGLLDLDRGKGLEEVATTLGVSRMTVSNWRNAYRASGLHLLEDAPRPGRPIEIDGVQRAKVTALACSPAPEGHARWTMRLLADKVVELGYCEHLSHTEVATILKATKSSHISRRRGVYRS